MNREQAKAMLYDVIKKSRVHLYKPIQIAKILYRDRVTGDIALSKLEDYRTKSKGWRDQISIKLLGPRCTSSSKFQDDLFNAIPPEAIVELGKENRRANGGVEAYIYMSFLEEHTQLKELLEYMFRIQEGGSLYRFSSKCFLAYTEHLVYPLPVPYFFSKVKFAACTSFPSFSNELNTGSSTRLALMLIIFSLSISLSFHILSKK